MPSKSQVSVPSRAGAFILYAGANALLVVAGKVPGQVGLSPELAFWVGRILAPVALGGIAVVVARAIGIPFSLLGFRRGTPAGTWWVAVFAGLPAVGVVLWHGATQGFDPLLSPQASSLALRVGVQQAWFEELLARGLLLAALTTAGLSERRCIWISAIAFGFMHLLQYFYPPVTLEGLANGVVLVVLTIPIGAALSLLALRAGSIWPGVLLHWLMDLPILTQTLHRPSMPLILLAALSPPLVILGWWLRARRSGGSGPASAALAA
jgi:membrane protease YdiL (CAAX protease family)